MRRLEDILDVDQLIKYWPRLLKVGRRDDPDVQPERLLQIYLDCLSNGVLFVIRTDSGIYGTCGAVHLSDGTLIIRAIPNDKGTGIAKQCVEHLYEWGHQNGCCIIEATTKHFNGSAFKYFTQCLGMNRKSVTFSLPIKINY